MASNDVLIEFGGVANNSLLNILGNENTEHFGNMQPSVYKDITELIHVLKSKKNNFTILSLNIQSLNSKFDQLKILISVLEECGCKIGAICIQETWLSDTDDTSIFQLDGYALISQHNISSNHGGVAIYLSKAYDYNTLPLYTLSEVWDGQFIEVKNPSADKKYYYWEHL